VEAARREREPSWREWDEQRKAKGQPAQKKRQAAPIKHGTDYGYKRGCSCAPCRAAHSAVASARKKRLRLERQVAAALAEKRDMEAVREALRGSGL
jgi:hypothetical protein